MSAEATDVIVIALDESDQAENAFEFYLKHLHHKGNEVVLVHCTEPLTMIGEMPNVDTYERMLTDTKDQAKKLEEKFSNRLKEKQISGRFIAAFGHRPGETIVAQAAEVKANLIVTGTRGLNTTRRTIMGSVSDFVVHHAHCPVVVCRK